MIVLDTHVWLWWLIAPRHLSRAARRAIHGTDAIGVSAISVFEIVELASRDRITLHAPVREWIRNALAEERVEALPITSAVATDAAQLHFAADPADRIIYATARSAGALLVTKDERLRQFDPSLAVW